MIVGILLLVFFIALAILVIYMVTDIYVYGLPDNFGKYDIDKRTDYHNCLVNTTEQECDKLFNDSYIKQTRAIVDNNGTCYTENPTLIYDDYMSSGAQKIFRDMIEDLPDDLAETICQKHIDENIGVPP